MNKRDALSGMLALSVAPLVSFAQAEKTYRVAWMLNTTAQGDAIGSKITDPVVILLLSELRALGYVEGRNLVLDRVSAEGHPERYAEIVGNLLRRKPDVIIVSGSEAAVAAQKATSTVPIVMNTAAQPVKYGLVASLARPGGNVTGLSADVNPETEAKRLELLKELVPKLSRVSCLATKWIWEGPYGQAIRQAAPALGIETLFAEHRPADLGGTFADIARQHTHALLVVLSPIIFAQRREIADFVLASRLPAIYPFSEMAQAGGLISYGWNLKNILRRTASYVDRILKGAKPADLPVEQPSVYEVVINLKTAKAMGVTFPKELLFRADKVIE